jgi:hypothetical protein
MWTVAAPARNALNIAPKSAKTSLELEPQVGLFRLVAV